jgi:hypothetical protein
MRMRLQGVRGLVDQGGRAGLRPGRPCPAGSIGCMTTFTQTILITDTDGRARFREGAVPLEQGTPQSMLSEVFTSGGYQLRTNPVGLKG